MNIYAGKPLRVPSASPEHPDGVDVLRTPIILDYDPALIIGHMCPKHIVLYCQYSVKRGAT
jgi:hypothetical protein